jgi:hypothetical protein
MDEQRIPKKFFKTVFRVEVLSEDEPVEDASCEDLHEMITTGDCSGVVKREDPIELTGAQAAAALLEQGSDPSFFNLDEQGRDLDDEVDET